LETPDAATKADPLMLNRSLMAEIVGTLLRAKVRNERANSSSEAWNSSRGYLMQEL